MKREELEKLKKVVKETSYNNLRRIYPFQLQEWMNVENQNLEEIIDELVNENLIEEKYDFQCDCGNDCTAYRRWLLKKEYRCSECDKSYCKADIENRATVLYELDKQSILAYKEKQIDIKKRIRPFKENKREMSKFLVEYEKDDIEKRKNKKIKVFLSYSHKDIKYKQELDKHLTPLKTSERIETWNDEELKVGSEFNQEIKERLESYDIIVLLISSDFLSSDYCRDIEMENAIKRAKAQQCHIVPVIVRPCMWKETPIKEFLALPKEGKPINKYKEKDDAYLEVASGIKKIVEDISG